MNIDEIRAEIPMAFVTTYRMKRWLHERGIEDAYSMLPCDAIPKIARILVDMAYEAGKADGFDNREAIGASEYNRGYEAGKAEMVGNSESYQQRPDDPDANGGDDYQRGYEAAAKDPKAWYVLDKNGERLHIGDKVSYDELNYEIDGIGSEGKLFILDDRTYHYCFIYADEVEKVIPDTREKIKQEIVDAIENDGDQFSNPDDLAEQFISRIEALAVDE